MKLLNVIVKLLLRILLLIIAVVATVFFSLISLVVSVIYNLVTFKWVTGLRYYSNYIYQTALSVDQLGNVTCQTVFNLTMVKRKMEFHPFGEEDDTISYCIAMNNKKGTLSRFGKFWAWFLNFVDKDHLKKSIQNKYLRDLEAWKRVEDTINEVKL